MIMGSRFSDDIMNLIRVIDNLSARSKSLCARFSDIKEALGIHQQKLVKLLDEGKEIGVISFYFVRYNSTTYIYYLHSAIH